MLLVRIINELRPKTLRMCLLNVICSIQLSMELPQTTNLNARAFRILNEIQGEMIVVRAVPVLMRKMK